ncbi:FCD domain-containing protein [Arthrobacter globiformis]|uniref:FCD domain-containing protein n=1 Tax=Arthrobacter globiformis TaxID=1665 RepID=UPI00277D8D4C|nr:FCD domain-containing protein [Arthrobacter globiformis]MDQ0863800.1 DNA-binding FadR family transcriptional regulator [Arthrobacter globiformis]
MLAISWLDSVAGPDPVTGANLEHSNQQHQEIVDAILRGDADGAYQVALDHLQGTASLPHGFLVSPEDSSPAASGDS